MNEEEKKEVLTLMNLSDEVKEMIQKYIPELNVQRTVLGMLFIIMEAVFLVAPNDTEAHKNINLIMVKAKKAADREREEYDNR